MAELNCKAAISVYLMSARAFGKRDGANFIALNDFQRIKAKMKIAGLAVFETARVFPLERHTSDIQQRGLVWDLHFLANNGCAIVRW